MGRLSDDWRCFNRFDSEVSRLIRTNNSRFCRATRHHCNFGFSGFKVRQVHLENSTSYFALDVGEHSLSALVPTAFSQLPLLVVNAFFF